MRRKLKERRAWEPRWLWQFFLASFALAVAIPIYAILEPPVPSWYGLLAVVACLFFTSVMGIEALYKRRWKRRSEPFRAYD
jgi:hypothetical protein